MFFIPLFIGGSCEVYSFLYFMSMGDSSNRISFSIPHITSTKEGLTIYIIEINGFKVAIYKGKWLDERLVILPPQRVNELKKEAKNGKVSHLSGEKPKEQNDFPFD